MTIKPLFVFLILFNIQTYCQVIDKDTVHNYSYNEIVVTGNRYETFLLQSTSSINKLSAVQLANYPVRDLVSTLQFTPGFFSVSLDGLGKHPVVTTRGFYGGGEAEYINLLVDGIETNYSQSGLANWQIIPTEVLNNIEILRGGSSSLYGDASIGGVININTLAGLEKTILSLNGGGYGQFNSSIYRNSSFGDHRYSFYGAYDDAIGFREHSDWMHASFGGNIRFKLTDNLNLSLVTHNQINDSELPGPITETELNEKRNLSSAYYKYDERKENRFIFSPSLEYNINEYSSLRLQLGIMNRTEDKTQTFTNFAPIINPQDFSIIGVYDTSQYGDTKQRELRSNEIFGEILFNSNFSNFPAEFVAGTKVNYSDYSSSYFDYYKGFKEDYESSNATRGNQVFASEGTRTELSAFVNSSIDILEGLRFNLGVRFDNIFDKYNSSQPDSIISSDNNAFSPKIGLNYLYSNNSDYKASLYFNYNKSFKAPTIDQLTDLKKLDFIIFIPIGPDAYTTSPYQADPFANSNLKPQKSNNYEFGTYQSISLSKSSALELQLSFYQIDIDDEIDFDLSTFKYQNIAKTKHRGIEFGSNIDFGKNLTAMLNYTYSEVTFESGIYNGKQLKGIPKHVTNFGFNYSFDFGLSAGIIFSSVNDIYLDDNNTEMLDNYLITNAKLAYTWENMIFSLSIFNLLDKEYNSTGYISDGTKYLYPAATRYLIFGVSYEI
ncbi:MAG: TonB-dependent receptor [Melioribacteraceae bacterium]|nr:TonB-dependent receptor [Melioribacteraceae bacterium]WKZ70811.1 MAG: TonB-dependent receptor [Melioribacteraceae bacterium]